MSKTLMETLADFDKRHAEAVGMVAHLHNKNREANGLLLRVIGFISVPRTAGEQSLLLDIEEHLRNQGVDAGAPVLERLFDDPRKRGIHDYDCAKVTAGGACSCGMEASNG